MAGRTAQRIFRVSLATAALLVAMPAAAQQLESRRWCSNQGSTFSPDLVIGGCTAVIQSGRETRQNLAIAFANRGFAHYNNKDYDRAIVDSSEAIRLDPKLSSAYNHRGNAYRAKLDYDRALADFTEAIRLDPKSALAYSNRGNVYYDRLDYDRAIADSSEAVRIDPTLTNAYLNRGNAYYVKQDYDRAIINYDQVIKLEPKNETATKYRSLAMSAKADRTAASSDEYDNPQGAYRALTLIGDVFERVRGDYFEKIDDWTIIKGAISKLLAETKPYSSDIDPQTFCGADWISRNGGASDTYEALNCFGAIFERVRSEASGRIANQKIVLSALNGMLDTLDSHSGYIDAKAFREMRVPAPDGFGGIGLAGTMENGLFKAAAPVDETPAHKAGISANDIVTHLDDQPVQGLTLDQVIQKLRGPVNTKIKLTIVREGVNKPVSVSITRIIVSASFVRANAMNDVGYIRIPQFNDQTTTQLREAIISLQSKVSDTRFKGFIIDLRNNPGGPLDQAISVTDAFIERGEIVSTRGRNANESQRFNARPGDLTRAKPIIVLINGGSAGASEIVAGALQDHKRATIIGTRSAGGGTIQTIIPLGGGNGSLRLTTARYFTPAGRSLQKMGISPDIEVIQQEITDVGVANKDDVRLRFYVPPNSSDDRALGFAVDLLRRIRKNVAFPPNPTVAAPAQK
jgi:carboxyl-terminal processing protease